MEKKRIVCIVYFGWLQYSGDTICSLDAMSIYTTIKWLKLNTYVAASTHSAAERHSRPSQHNTQKRQNPYAYKQTAPQ